MRLAARQHHALRIGGAEHLRARLSYLYQLNLEILGLGLGPVAPFGFARVSGEAGLPSVRGEAGYAPLASAGIRVQLTRELFSGVFIVAENDLSAHFADVEAAVDDTIIAQWARASWSGAIGLGVHL